MALERSATVSIHFTAYVHPREILYLFRGVDLALIVLSFRATIAVENVSSKTSFSKFPLLFLEFYFPQISAILNLTKRIKIYL